MPTAHPWAILDMDVGNGYAAILGKGGANYRIWQDASSVKVFEAINNTPYERSSFPAANAAGQTHSYQALYDPLTGKLQVWRDNVFLGSWTDTTPLTSGGYIALRTDGADVSFDGLIVLSVVKYYCSGGQRIALQRDGTVSYLLTDQLGSTRVTTSDTGARVAELKYYPFGDTRYNSGNDTPSLPQKTTFRFTGQRWDPGTALYFYGSRWYDPVVGRFIQADTIVPQPGDPQSLNRYSYVLNNPTVYVDPTGHAQVCADGDEGGGCGRGASESEIFALFAQHGKYKWFAQAYASIYAADLAEARGDVDAADMRASSDSYLQEARYFLPQSDWRAAAPLMVDPGSAYQVGSALTAGGAKVIGALIGVQEAKAAGKTGALIPYYPPNDGFAGKPAKITLEPGAIIDRYGSPRGRYASPQGTPAGARALPPGAETAPLNAYEVIKPLQVDAGPTAAWFGQPGGGTQYYLGNGVEKLIELGYLRPLQ